ncbi:DUF1850 domain-containing protein [Halodesulfurarchaeum sp.]|uniref:DUF1850 domain-containing protein n=1 Tax=Halodesulfurarchaeum sp. TaxID=1980530 RepID=UPI001BC0F0CF|nr:DUF1850 domain-containing protein [Halodesulfurarchaeum sp.]
MRIPDWPVHRWFLIAVVLFAAIGLAGATAGGQSLVVERVDTGETIIETPVSNGSIVALEYTHSVEKTRVYDEYTVVDSTLENTRMEFESYGWGLPAGANVTREDGVFVFDPAGEYDQFIVKPGRVANHTLHVDETQYDLVERSDANSVIIRVTRSSPLTRLRECLRIR